MPHAIPTPAVTLDAVAHFPPGFFLENLAVRPDGSLLVTTILQKRLWWVPAPDGAAPVEPSLVHDFGRPVTGIVEVLHDVYLISVTDMYQSHRSTLYRVDFEGWTPGAAVVPEALCDFGPRAGGLNGSALLGPRTLAVADCFTGLIWRVDLDDDVRTGEVREWLADGSMDFDPGSDVAPPPQPGVNGVRYAPRRGFLYYTSTAQKVFMRVPVDPDTLEPAGAPQFVAAIDNADDFCLDEDAGFAYVTRHRGNSLDRVPLDQGHGSEVVRVAGEPFDGILVGPSSMVWGREPGDVGRRGYLTTDGGTTAPPPGGRGDALLLRVTIG